MVIDKHPCYIKPNVYFFIIILYYMIAPAPWPSG